jgi:hypothetical protein
MASAEERFLVRCKVADLAPEVYSVLRFAGEGARATHGAVEIRWKSCDLRGLTACALDA